MDRLKLSNGVEVHFFHYPGYGGPETWKCVVEYDNRLLEEHETQSAVGAGVLQERLQAKWSAKDPNELAKLVDGKKPLSPLCCKCGRKTMGGRMLYVGNDVWCQRCADDREHAQKVAEIEARFLERPPTDDQLSGGPWRQITPSEGEHVWGRLTFKRRADGSVIVRRWDEEREYFHHVTVEGDYVVRPTQHISLWSFGVGRDGFRTIVVPGDAWDEIVKACER